MHEYLLKHKTSENGFLNIIKEGSIKTPKKRGTGFTQGSTADFIFFSAVKNITNDNEFVFYTDFSIINSNNSFFIHPTANIYKPLSYWDQDEIKNNVSKKSGCKWWYEYISPKLEHKLQLEKIKPNKYCRVSFNEAMDLLEEDIEGEESENEIGFNNSIKLRDIVAVNIPKKYVVPKIISNILHNLDIQIISGRSFGKKVNKEYEEYEEVKNRCKAVTTRGSVCSFRANDSGYCGHHTKH